MWMQKLEVETPYNFDRVLERMSLDPLNVVDLYNREVKVPLYDESKQPFVVEVKAIGRQFMITGEDENQRDTALSEMSRIFGWNVPLSVIHSHFERTNLAELFEEHEGTPLVLDFHVYNCLMKCFIHQQLNIKFAYVLTERFVRTFGFEIDGVPFYPSADTVAKLEYEQLTELQFSRRKAEYIIDTARKIAENEINLEQLETMTNEEVLENLIKVRGIGAWTVQNVLLFGLGRPNLFPTSDIGLQNAMKQFFKLENKPAKEEMDALSEKWSPYLSYASLYLWRSIE
ncbi:DNA-3-methyladenine glycosylase family protein [Metabacillus fastidiosus]|uniref:DNA-3-methyladenine glycosylase family protein n=1 Tax=Metabacillus fastidiosus TaxID=1458 RepID=UPI003D291E96